ncbi:recombinase family protein, partial [Actinomadura sp. DSM 109109]|nr:recombinase family protein [Actinomadura lepetitiana]
PGGTKWSSTTFDSNRKLGWGLFNNELYVGRLVWNRTHGEKDPDSGKYRYVVNPPDEWFRRDVPQLRIVSDELWEAVKRRQEAGSRAKNGIKISKTIAEGKRMGGRLPRRPLGGILKCAVCSGNIQADNTKDYICGRHSVGACSN